MKIGIIGIGFVGKAVAAANPTCNIIINDPAITNSVPLCKFITCDAIYVCVPSPSLITGACDTSILEQTLIELFNMPEIRNIPIICKTTAPPSTYKTLQDIYPNIIHAPEFLTAENNINDYLQRTSTILGGDYKWTSIAEHIISYNQHSKYNYVHVDIITAALYKYMINSYLATKVTFMNEFKLLADKLNIDWNNIKQCALTDSRIGNSHMSVPGPDGNYGWGGACFPKDISAIIADAKLQNLSMHVLETVQTTNTQHRKINEN